MLLYLGTYMTKYVPKYTATVPLLLGDLSAQVLRSSHLVPNTDVLPRKMPSFDVRAY